MRSNVCRVIRFDEKAIRETIELARELDANSRTDLFLDVVLEALSIIVKAVMSEASPRSDGYYQGLALLLDLGRIAGGMFMGPSGSQAHASAMGRLARIEALDWLINREAEGLSEPGDAIVDGGSLVH